MMSANTKKMMISLVVLLALFSFSNVLADVLMITPKSVTLPLKGHVKFEAQLFNDAALAVIMQNEIEWQVYPETLGRITDDGFFMAGNKPGRGTVVAILRTQNKTLKAEAKVEVGHPIAIQPNLPKLIVTPEKAAVDLGDTIQFKAELRYLLTNREIPNVMIQWTIEPRTLGKITQKGKFFAGNLPGAGKVIAYVNYMGIRIVGEAYVVVGARPSSEISGIVMDEDNQTVIEKAVVVAQRIGPMHWYKRTLTGKSGTYRLGDLIPGWYVVYAMKEGFIKEFYKDVRYIKEATPLQLAYKDSIDKIDFNLNHGGAIAGTIYTEGDSSLLADAHVVSFLKLNPDRKFHTMTDEKGSYVISGLHTGAYVVSANKDGYKGEFYDNVKQQLDATLVDVADPDTTFEIDFALDMNSAISGTVISDADDSPIKGVIVSARNLNHTNWMNALRTKTDENGNYVLQAPPGNYIVKAEADSFNGEFYDDEYEPALATPVEVTEDQHTSGINFSLAPLSVITGYVTDHFTNEGIMDAVVYAFPEIGGGQPVKARTDEQGFYELNRLLPGIYFIHAKAEGYYPEFFEEAATLADATPMPVKRDTLIGGVDFTLEKTATINGIVTEEGSLTPISRALIIARRFNSHFERRTFSKDDGTYEIKGLPAGKYFVKAMAEGYYREFYDNKTSYQDADTVVVNNTGSTDGIDFSLTPAPDNQGVITGFVYEESVLTSQADLVILPIPGALVVALPIQGGMPHFGVTNPEGRYTLKGLETGKYYVLAWAAGYIGEFYDNVHHWKKATPVGVVSPNITPNINFGLAKKLIGPYVIRGRILARNNQKPVANALVYAFRHQEIVGFGITDEQGNYQIPEMPAGSYNVIASAPGFVQDNDQNSSTEDSLSVTLDSGQSPLFPDV